MYELWIQRKNLVNSENWRDESRSHRSCLVWWKCERRTRRKSNDKWTIIIINSCWMWSVKVSHLANDQWKYSHSVRLSNWSRSNQRKHKMFLHSISRSRMRVNTCEQISADNLLSIWVRALCQLWIWQKVSVVCARELERARPLFCDANEIWLAFHQRMSHLIAHRRMTKWFYYFIFARRIHVKCLEFSRHSSNGWRIYITYAISYCIMGRSTRHTHTQTPSVAAMVEIRRISYHIFRNYKRNVEWACMRFECIELCCTNTSRICAPSSQYNSDIASVWRERHWHVVTRRVLAICYIFR